MIDLQNEITPITRGQWCNLCGSRLVGKSSPLRFAGWSRRVEGKRTRADSEATWSICMQCYQQRLRCAACGTLVGPQAFMLEGDLHFYCRHCFEQRPRCDTCDRPVGAHYWTRPDGRKLCDRCQSTAISDPKVAYALYERVTADLAKRLGMTLREPCQLKLVSRRQLLSLVDKSSLRHLDADSRGRCFGLFFRQGSRRAIFIEYGLPQIVLLEVMAHEYAHAWQCENCPENVAPEVQEGFAEWVAYKLLQGWGCYRRSDRMLRRDDLYGRGLKMVLGWEKQGGVAEVFRRVAE